MKSADKDKAKTVERQVELFAQQEKKEHSAAQEAEKEREKAEKREQQKAVKEAARQRLEELALQSSSKERDSEIVSLIRTLCKWKFNKFNAPYEIDAVIENLDLIFNYDPVIAGLLGFNEFADKIALLKQPPWRKEPCKQEAWQDSDFSSLKNYIRREYQNLHNEQLILDVVIEYAGKKSFHPVKEYFKNLPKWDGKARVENLFIDWLGVEDTPYTREATKIWLIAAIARIYHPGCNFQAALTLQGNQNVGKSYILEKLGGEFYATLNYSLDDAHAIDVLSGTWIMEMKEFSAGRKAEINAAKSFIERGKEKYRPAYAQWPKELQRQCVLAITVNDDSFLRDLTGNRRFWILQSTLPKFGVIKEVGGEKFDEKLVAQIWAETLILYKELFKEGFDANKLQLSFENQIYAESVAEKFVVDDGLYGEITAFLDLLIPPPVVWNLLSKGERKAFFDRNSIEYFELSRHALEKRQRDKGLNVQDLFNELEKYYDGFHETYRLTGKVQRQTICAAELYNELPNAEKLATQRKFSEALSELQSSGDWRLGKRNKNYEEYGDQKKILYRVAPVTDDKAVAETAPVGKAEYHEATADAQEYEEKIFSSEDYQDNSGGNDSYNIPDEVNSEEDVDLPF